MDTRHIVRSGAVVVAALLLLTFAFAFAPAAPCGAPAAVKSVAPAAASAAEATATSATAAPAESAAPKAEEAKTGEAKGETPHKVGNPSQSQLADLRRAWDSIPGFDLLLIAILGLIVTVGVVGFGAFKQMKV
ncbi:MAG TPA: hypothetical protein VGK50_04695 [Coriobacteriia bacterium]|jgi:hypothetical protein